MIASVDIEVKKAQVLTQIAAVEEGEIMGEIMKERRKTIVAVAEGDIQT